MRTTVRAGVITFGTHMEVYVATPGMLAGLYALDDRFFSRRREKLTVGAY
jgi:hypothetical protein